MGLSKEEKAVRWKAYYQTNRERLIQKARDRYEQIKNTPEFIEKRRGWSRRTNRTRRGVLNATTEAHHGVCPICENTRKLVCDHWHEGPKAGEVRGWLCVTCNSFLGGRRLENAIAYLKD